MTVVKVKRFYCGIAVIACLRILSYTDFAASISSLL